MDLKLISFFMCFHIIVARHQAGYHIVSYFPLIYFICSFACVCSWKKENTFFPWKKFARTMATQSMTTYRREWGKPSIRLHRQEARGHCMGALRRQTKSTRRLTPTSVDEILMGLSSQVPPQSPPYMGLPPNLHTPSTKQP